MQHLTGSSRLHRLSTRVRCVSAAKPYQPHANRAGSDPPESAAKLVWGLPPTVHKPLVHVVTKPQLAVTQIVPLAVEQLHPDNLTTPTLNDFIAQSLISRAAKRQGTGALVLSAVYLPSQLDVMQDLAGKQSVDHAVYLSKDNSAMHVVFHTLRQERQQDDQQQQPSTADLASALEATLGPLQPLSSARLQVARMAERSLRQQLRLWDAASWATVLQQRLESRKRDWPWLAVRSLMGPAALQAALLLVERKGLHWVEVPEGQMKALAGSASTGSTSISTGSRRRPGRRTSGTTEQGTGTEMGAGSPGEQQGGGGDGGRVVIVISTSELTAEEAAEVPRMAFTDYTIEASSSSGGGGSGGGVMQEVGVGTESPRRWPNIFGM